ncbi:MAG TPA: plastocyanin/azurin family copper-binding protein [Acidimicrobiales bacterium]|nr:plastocyanin/azurin family copper-binding protein [Acidimicrobiales bacterium]
MTPRRALLPSLVLAAVLLSACGDDDDSTAADAPAADAVVTMEESRFAPDSLDVAPGTEVTFENLDPYAHTVTAAEGSTAEFDSGQLGEGDTFVQTFDDAGTYEYFCEIHPTMRAEVVVG